MYKQFFFFFQQWATFGRTWYLYDLKWQNPFHSARKIAYVLSGRNKPIYDDRGKNFELFLVIKLVGNTIDILLALYIILKVTNFY